MEVRAEPFRITAPTAVKGLERLASGRPGTRILPHLRSDPEQSMGISHPAPYESRPRLRQRVLENVGLHGNV
jgi:hypothetical protein